MQGCWRNCLRFASARLLPPAVRGPVLRPPCIRHRPFLGRSLYLSHTAGALQVRPARVRAPQRGLCLFGVISLCFAGPYYTLRICNYCRRKQTMAAKYFVRNAPVVRGPMPQTTPGFAQVPRPNWRLAARCSVATFDYARSPDPATGCPRCGQMPNQGASPRTKSRPMLFPRHHRLGADPKLALLIAIRFLERISEGTNRPQSPNPLIMWCPLRDSNPHLPSENGF